MFPVSSSDPQPCRPTSLKIQCIFSIHQFFHLFSLDAFLFFHFFLLCLRWSLLVGSEIKLCSYVRAKNLISINNWRTFAFFCSKSNLGEKRIIELIIYFFKITIVTIFYIDLLSCCWSCVIYMSAKQVEKYQPNGN